MIGSWDHRVLALPARGLLAGQRVGIAPSGPAGPALLRLTTPSGSRAVAVVVHPLPEVPAGVLAVGEDLRDDAGLRGGTQWTLEPSSAVDASRLVLELSTERSPESVSRQIADAGLAGTVLWAPSVDDDAWLDVADVPYRVLEIDAGPRRDVIARIGPHTAVELFAPGVKAGVDMVVLADCSGSMEVDDIPVPAESAWAFHGRRYIRRIDALRQALRDLLEVRLRVGGRVSRIALIAFTTTTTAWFPRTGGMAELDGSSPSAVIDEFRQAGALLKSGGATSIGNALHAAADLLYRHGHPGNERLVVLVSDGAEWHPRGEQGTGEIMSATSEPVSLMSHLHRDMKIRLHAIGISTPELYLRRYPPRPALVPDHALLEELVKVGGGDPTTIGGLDVLVEYFSGVGGGITHRVRGALSSPRQPALDGEARRLLADAARAPDAGTGPGDGLADALEELGAMDLRIETLSRRVFPVPLFPRGNVGRAVAPFRSGMTEATLAAALRRLPMLMSPALPADQRPPRVLDWVSLVEGLAALVTADPPDLYGLATVCGAAGSRPGELAVGVVRRLTRALTEIAEEADGLPDHGGAAAPPPQGTTAAPPDTDPATAWPAPTVPEPEPVSGGGPGGFVYKD